MTSVATSACFGAMECASKLSNHSPQMSARYNFWFSVSLSVATRPSPSASSDGVSGRTDAVRRGQPPASRGGYVPAPGARCATSGTRPGCSSSTDRVLGHEGVQVLLSESNRPPDPNEADPALGLQVDEMATGDAQVGSRFLGVSESGWLCDFHTNILVHLDA